MINVMTEAGYAEYVAEIEAVPSMADLRKIRARRVHQEAVRYRLAQIDASRPSPRPIQIMIDVIDREMSRRFW